MAHLHHQNFRGNVHIFVANKYTFSGKYVKKIIMIVFSSNIPLHYYFELLSFNSLVDTILKTYEKETRGRSPEND